jgi:hypothetical protein
MHHDECFTRNAPLHPIELPKKMAGLQPWPTAINILIRFFCRNSSGQSLAGRMYRIIFSGFLAWHVFAAGLVGISPQESKIRELTPFVTPYLHLLKIYNPWTFYSPNPALGRFVTLEIEDSEGRVREQPLSHQKSRWQPAYFRYTGYYYYLFDDLPRTYALALDASTALYHCRSLNADNSLWFLNHQQRPFGVEDFNQGFEPLDDEFVLTSKVGPYPCRLLLDLAPG